MGPDIYGNVAKTTTAASSLGILSSTASILGPVGIAASGLASLFGGLAEKDAAKKAAALEERATSQLASNVLAEARADLGATEFGYVSAGVRADTGSPLLVMAEKARNYSQEVRTIREVGASRAAATRARGDAAAVRGGAGFVSSLGQLGEWYTSRA